MNDPTHDIERLISRHLDDEATADERRALNAQMRRDPAAAALFEDYAELDREVKHALRSVLGHSPMRSAPVWQRTLRVFALAAAACIAVMFWSMPGGERTTPGPQGPTQASSWFAPPPAAGDTLVEYPTRFDRPQMRFTRPQTDWVVIPSDTPGEFLVIQVKRVPTRTIRVHKDF
jgi:hypothetical protein